MLKRWTSKQIEEEMYDADMQTLMYLWDVLENFDNRKLSKAFNRGLWGER